MLIAANLRETADDERARILTREWFAFLERERWKSENLIHTSQRIVILTAMDACNKVQLQAAALIGVAPSSLNRYLRKLGMTNKQFHPVRKRVA